MLNEANKKGSPESKAKKWGNAHGYEGREGGWIYSKNSGKPIVQGWWRFYERYRTEIEGENRCKNYIETPEGIAQCDGTLFAGQCPKASQHMGAQS